jgi:hypothetical protein
MRAMVDESTHLAVESHHEAAQWPVPAADGEASCTRNFYVIEPADDPLDIDRLRPAHARC